MKTAMHGMRTARLRGRLHGLAFMLINVFVSFVALVSLHVLQGQGRSSSLSLRQGNKDSTRTFSLMEWFTRTFP